jgi:hypothetical protein
VTKPESVTKRVRQLNDARIQPGKYVLYWSQMNRRVEANHALAFTAGLANQEGLPVLVYEGLTCSYPNANDRFHTFLLEGVEETERRLGKLGIGYVFHLRRKKSDPNDAFYQLAEEASAVVTDDYPAFIAGAQLPCADEGSRSLLRGGFELHRADESFRKAGVRGIYNSSEDPPRGRGIFAAANAGSAQETLRSATLDTAHPSDDGEDCGAGCIVPDRPFGPAVDGVSRREP